MTNDDRDRLLVRTEALLEALIERVNALAAKVETLWERSAARRGGDGWRVSAVATSLQVVGLIVALALGILGLLR